MSNKKKWIYRFRVTYNNHGDEIYDIHTEFMRDAFDLLIEKIDTIGYLKDFKELEYIRKDKP